MLEKPLKRDVPWQPQGEIAGVDPVPMEGTLTITLIWRHFGLLCQSLFRRMVTSLSDAETLPQVDAPHVVVAHDLIGGAAHKDATVVKNVGAVHQF